MQVGKLLTKLLLVISIFINLLFSVVSNTSIAPETFSENQTKLIEMYRLRITNSTNGQIEASVDRGKSWQFLGKVINPTEKVNNQGFTASKWGKTGTVVASAVNAIHIKTAHNNNDDKGVIFSILPADQRKKSSDKYKSYLSPDSSIYTDIRGGSGIFGGEWSALVGNLIYLEKDNRLFPLPYNYQPGLNDRIIIKVCRPDPYPTEIIFENRYGGLIYIKYLNGKTKPIGQVLKPVYGIGRFIGTQDSDVGRIRANHNGVIDISTSPLNKVGGFQIIPANHSESPEMQAAKIKTQWMIIAPLDALTAGNEGSAPFFSGFIIPRYNELDLYDKDWIEKSTKRTLVTVKYQGKDGWKPMPVFYVDPKKPLPEKYNTVLKNVEKIRILFPLFRKQPDSL